MISVVLVMSLCTNKSTDPIFPKRDGLVGRWQLIETCISPGGGCVLEKITNGLIIDFKSDGTYLVENNAINQGVFFCKGRWNLGLISDSFWGTQVQIAPECNKGIWNLYFTFTEKNTLNLNYQCIEECRYTYKPI